MAALLAVASGFVLIGGWVWSERRDRLTRTFFLLCLAFAWLLAPLPRWRSEASGALYDALYTGVGLYLPALFIHFFALFPESGQPRGRLRSATTIAYGVATGLFGASFLIMLAEPVFGAVAAAAQSLIQGMAGLWFAFGLLAALYVFAGSYRRARSTDARRRLRVALAGTVLGALPFATLVAVRNLSPAGPIPGERLAVLLTLLVPASFAWATGVHRVFEFKVALRAAVVLVVLATLGGLVYVAGEWLAAAWRQDLGSGLAGGALTFVALTAAVAGPASRWLRSLGARFVPDVATATERLDAEPGARGGSPGHVVEAACQALAGAFHLDGCLALEFARGGLRTVARAGVTVSPPPETDFTAALPEGGGVVALEDLHLRAPDRRALERAGVAWLLPVGGTVRHCLMLGRRLGGSWFGLEDQRELRRFAGHLEVLLENARLREAASTHGARDRELSKAGAIQAHLLPRRVPVVPLARLRGGRALLRVGRGRLLRLRPQPRPGGDAGRGRRGRQGHPRRAHGHLGARRLPGPGAPRRRPGPTAHRPEPRPGGAEPAGGLRGPALRPGRRAGRHVHLRQRGAHPAAAAAARWPLRGALPERRPARGLPPGAVRRLQRRARCRGRHRALLGRAHRGPARRGGVRSGGVRSGCSRPTPARERPRSCGRCWPRSRPSPTNPWTTSPWSCSSR